MKLRRIRIPALLILGVLPGLAQQPAEQSGAARLPAGMKAHPDLAYATADDPPFLIVHGSADPLVPPHQSERLYEALQKTSVNVRLHIIKGSGHGQGFGGREIDEMVNSFFDRCLKGTPSSTAATGATRNESVASNQPAAPSGPPEARGQRFTFEQIRSREDGNGDGRVPREEFKGPPPLFDRLERNHDGVLTREDFDDGRPGSAK